jgi:hypothetical protein
MDRGIRWNGVAATVLFLASWGTVQRACADQIVGDYPGIDPASGSHESTFQLLGGHINSGPGAGLGTQDLLIDVTPYGVSDSHVNFLAFFEGPPIFEIRGPSETVADWTILSPGVLDPNDPKNGEGTIRVDMSLDFNNIVGLDLTEFAMTTLTLTFTGIEIDPGGTGPQGGSATWLKGNVSAHFVIGEPVPEPQSLALVFSGLATLAGMGGWYRHRSRPSA